MDNGLEKRQWSPVNFDGLTNGNWTGPPVDPHNAMQTTLSALEVTLGTLNVIYFSYLAYLERSFISDMLETFFYALVIIMMSPALLLALVLVKVLKLRLR